MLFPQSAHAQPLQVPSTRYAYDALNRLTGVSRSVPGTGFSCTYDGEGKRISVTEGGVTTTFLYDGLLPVLERQGGSTTVNVWGLSYGGGIGGLLARVTPSGALYPLYDGSGNVLAWTDSTGAIISTTAYTAFGEPINQSGPTQSYGFSTKSYSSATNLSYFGARYYRPDLSRWMTLDPLGMVDGPNLYAYAGNNPVSFIDPWGFDYWIEGSSAGEPGSHQSINVGDPNGHYDSYSFGWDMGINLRYGLEGQVYRDPMKGGPIDQGSYRETTPQEDAVIKAYLESQVGRKGPYTFWSTCRTFSQNEFLNLAKKGLGHPSKNPPRSNSSGQPSQSVPPLSSTITSSEPYGFPSGTTNRRMPSKKK